MKNTDCQQIDKCPFCNKLIADNFFLASPHFKAIYNIAPILAGHSLIIPERHVESLMELTDAELSEMMIFARKVTQLLKTVFSCDSFDWSIQDGVSAGQTVSHLHLHIIPRKPHDLPECNDWFGKIPNCEQHLLDSGHRERLDDQDYNRITAMLIEATASLPI